MAPCGNHETRGDIARCSRIEAVALHLVPHRFRSVGNGLAGVLRPFTSFAKRSGLPQRNVQFRILRAILGSDAGRFNRLQLVFTRAFELGYATEEEFYVWGNVRMATKDT